MARRVISVLVASLIVAGCVTVEAGPSLGPTAEPTPVATLTPTPPPTEPPTPAPTGTPERTLAPGETPQPTPLDISSLLTATLALVNLSDEVVIASVDFVNEGESAGTVAELEVEPYGTLFQSVPAAEFIVKFTVGAADPVECQLVIAEGAEMDFTVVGGTILVSQPSVPPAESDDLFLETSPVCA